MRYTKLLTLIFLLLGFVSLLNAKQTSFTVAIDKNYLPYTYKGKDGTFQGLFIDYWQLWAKKNNYTVKFIPFGWIESIEKVKDGSVDFHSSIFNNNKKLYLTTFIHAERLSLLSLESSEIQSYTDLDGKKIGVIEPSFAQKLKRQNSNIEIVLVKNYKELIQKVIDKELDGLLDNKLSIELRLLEIKKLHQFRKIRLKDELVISARPASHKKELIDVFEKGWKKLKKQELSDIENRWIRDEKDKIYLINSPRKIKFSSEEIAFINSNPIIKYSEIDWKPITIVKNNTMTGMAKEYLDIITRESGIKFKFIPSSSWSETLRKLEDGKIDLIPGLGEAQKWASAGNLSNIYAAYPMSIITNDDISYVDSLEEVKDKIFALPENFTSYNYIKSKFPNAKIIKTTTIKEALENVADKKADLFVGHIAAALYGITELGRKNLKIAGEAQKKFNHYFLISKNSPELLSIINKVFQTITEREKNKIYHDWVYTDVKESFDYSILWKIGAVIFLIFAIILYYTRKINNQKILIQQIHKQTKASIEYASIIQDAIIPSDDILKEYFSDYFTIWQPKDIVGGDIYLFNSLRDRNECLIMVIDCTGHGVPGAFVTMIVKAIEREIITKINNDKSVEVSPAWILSYFNKTMKTLLKQENKDSVSNAGFDGGILYFNKKDKIIKFTGANIALAYMKESSINLIKGDRYSIGYKKSDASYKFTEHTLHIEKGMQFYLTTDGLIDQIGGDKGFPFGRKRFKNILEQNKKLNMNQQKDILVSSLLEYQKDEARTDDIAVVGVKID